MKFNSFSLSLFTVSILLPVVPSLTSVASAQCVMIDTSVQTAIHGSKNPSVQQNNANMNSQGPCVGNSAVSTNAQTAVSPGDVTQIRNSNQSITGSGGPTGPGLGGPVIKIPVEVKTDVYSPAQDPNFMGGLNNGGQKSFSHL